MAGRFLRELTIRQLRALAAVHKHRSVTAAAKQLHLTQPAVTLQLRNLQALAGLPLIQRTSDGMLLTDAGREVLALSERIEAAIAILRYVARYDRRKDRRAHFDRRRQHRQIFRAVRDLRIFQAVSEHRCHALDRKPAGNRHRAARLRSGHRHHGPAAGRYSHGRPSDRRSSACHHCADGPSPGAKAPAGAGRPCQRNLPDARTRIRHARPDGAIVRTGQHAARKSAWR